MSTKVQISCDKCFPLWLYLTTTTIIKKLGEIWNDSFAFWRGKGGVHKSLKYFDNIKIYVLCQNPLCWCWPISDARGPICLNVSPPVLAHTWPGKHRGRNTARELFQIWLERVTDFISTYNAIQKLSYRTWTLNKNKCSR